MIWESFQKRKMYGKVNIISSSKFGPGIFGFVVGISQA